MSSSSLLWRCDMNLVLPGPNYVTGCIPARSDRGCFHYPCCKCHEIQGGRIVVAEICDSHVGKAYGVCTAQRGSFLGRLLFRVGRFSACLGSCTLVPICMISCEQVLPGGLFTARELAKYCPSTSCCELLPCGGPYQATPALKSGLEVQSIDSDWCWRQNNAITAGGPVPRNMSIMHYPAPALRCAAFA